MLFYAGPRNLLTGVEWPARFFRYRIVEVPMPAEVCAPAVIAVVQRAGLAGEPAWARRRHQPNDRSIGRKSQGGCEASDDSAAVSSPACGSTEEGYYLMRPSAPTKGSLADR
jgi:hypothetical protein